MTNPEFDYLYELIKTNADLLVTLEKLVFQLELDHNYSIAVGDILDDAERAIANAQEQMK